MLFFVPLELKESNDSATIPVANGLLVTLNVLLFWLGWQTTVGPGSGPLSVWLYGFTHIGVWHLIGNMWFLLVFGNPVNRRLGNAWYLLAYMGTILFIGLFARLFIGGQLAGASGAVSAVIIIAVMLMPAARLEVIYIALFPITLLVGLLKRPPHWVYWFLRWDKFGIKAVWCLMLLPLLELWSLFWSGWNWTNLGHLMGMLCGVVVVLLLPKRISMGKRALAGTW